MNYNIRLNKEELRKLKIILSNMGNNHKNDYALYLLNKIKYQTE